ncbi:lipopolysaccharide biosynthesis protein [Thiothrix subterranea]|uniref:Oligosaccharide flippase family protein n=1 Tax=Thiothrix subterranea TaxID=2735563 RepID=A0AA51R344_9GAMM|nr:oligosaccharide flippase family protein [Thiothrix subterranea]WML88584.1 oligosaccharide flippase family protein [Thiothrix subterranea]
MKLFGNASIYFGANILNAAIPFLLLPILTRVLTPAEYGTIAMFLVMVSIFSAFTGLSVHGAIGVRYFQLSKEDLADYVTSCIGILVVSTTAVMLIVMVLHHWIIKVSGISLDWLIVAVLVSGLQFLINIRLSLWQVSGMPWHYGGLQISRSLLDALLSLILVLGLSMAWQGRLIGYSTSLLLMGVIALVWLYNDQFLRRTDTWKIHAKDALRFGIPLIPHTIGGMLMVLVDRIIINNLLGTDSVGVYMVALQMGMVIGLLTESFNKAYAPWLFKNLASEDKANKPSIVKGTYFYFFAILAVATLYGLLIPFVMPFIVGEEFLLSGEFIIYLAIGFAFGGCYYMVTNYIFFAKRTEYLALVTFGSGVLNIPITYILVQEMQLKGAAVAFLITNIITFLGTWILSNSVYKMPWLFVKRASTIT